MVAATPAVAAVIPAKDEAERIGATVRAAALLPGVDLVVVVDDGSQDDTASLARAAGATVVAHSSNRGKGAAMMTGAAEVARVEALADLPDAGHAAADDPATAATVPPRALLFVDADLEDTAAHLAPLIPPVLAGEADMTIATLPPQPTTGGGHGFVVRLAREGIAERTGWTPKQPLSGQRCLTRAAFDQALPLAPGWGVEVGLSIDVLLAGGRVVEIECDLRHRVTGKDWRSQLHRAAQYRDVRRALWARKPT